MQQSNKVLASVAGVCITSAVVVGAVLGTSGGGHKAPVEHPAGHSVPIASTVTVTASPTAATGSPARSSKATTKAAVRHRKVQRAAVPVNQEPAVTDPSTSTDPAQQVTTGPSSVDTIHGSAVRHGPTDAPPSHVEIGYPDDTLSPSPKE